MQRYNFFMIYQTFPPYLYIVREINKDGTQRCLTLLRPQCEHRDQFFIKTTEGKMDGQMNFLAIISRKDNPMLAMVIEEFNETISFLFDPPEEQL